MSQQQPHLQTQLQTQLQDHLQDFQDHLQDHLGWSGVVWGWQSLLGTVGTLSVGAPYTPNEKLSYLDRSDAKLSLTP